MEWFWRWAGFWAGFLSGIIAHSLYHDLNPSWLRPVLFAGIIIIFIISGIPLARRVRGIA